MEKKVRPIDANALARKIREYMRSLPASTARIMEYHKVLSMLGDEGQTPTLQLGCNIAATGEPLTLEQLRGMVNKPYWHVGLREDSGAPHWSILDPLLAYHPEDYDYGAAWLAYAYPPAHIDREGWEPCRICGFERIMFRATEVVNCPCGGTDIGGLANFCPLCGRPLTEEAWAELEKRLRG